MRDVDAYAEAIVNAVADDYGRALGPNLDACGSVAQDGIALQSSTLVPI